MRPAHRWTIDGHSSYGHEISIGENIDNWGGLGALSIERSFSVFLFQYSVFSIEGHPVHVGFLDCCKYSEKADSAEKLIKPLRRDHSNDRHHLSAEN